jgi:hypothetical protein
MIHRLIFLLLALAAPAFGTTYYVDPSSGSNANDGMSAATAWLTPPGTRNVEDTAYLSSAWGARMTSRPLSCGDLILLRGGTTQTSAEGGAWCLSSGGGCATSGSYYPTTCTAASPITIRVATSDEWAGSTGPFTINQAGINPADSASFNYAGIITISRVSGIVLKGASPTQLIILAGTMTRDANNDVDLEIDGHVSGLTIQYLEAADAPTAGIAMGDVSDSLVSDVIVDNNVGPGINCGQQVHHNCNRVGWVNLESAFNGTNGGDGTGFYCDSLYIQGSQQLYVINPYVHDNGCNGMNIGAGDHAYPYRARTLIRDGVFSHNGLWNNINNSKSNFQGGGDTYPSEVGAPTSGYCSGGPADGTVCTDNTPCDGLACSIYDAYSVFERVVSFGAMSNGAYVHHGSGFTWWNRLTVLHNNLGGYFAGELMDDRVAADHMMSNSIIVNQPGGTLLEYNTNGIHSVCRQNCPRPGIPCSSNADCGTCATGTNAACGQYLPMMAVKSNLLRPSLPSGTDTEALSGFSYICDSQCAGGTAGHACASDAQCTGCVGGCNWTNSGGTFASVATSLPFLNDPSNKIGAAYDPLFVNISAADCANGTDVTACDLRLQAGSPAIDAGTFLMLTNGAGSGTVINVKENVASRGTIDFNGLNGDPNTFFIPPNGYPGAVGDTIQIQNATCPTGNPVIVSMTTSSITLDRSCTWADGMGVDLPWNGAAPDMGAFESEATTSTLPATTTTTTMTAPPTFTTFPTTTSTSSMSSTTSTSLATSSTTTTTTSTLPRHKHHHHWSSP